MTLNELLGVIPFPYRVQSTSPYSLAAESEGTIIDQPAYGRKNDNFWETIDSEGWRTCNAGFAVVAKRLPDTSSLLILHGLKVKPYWSQRGHTKGISIVLDFNRMERYIQHFLDEFSRLKMVIGNEIEQRTRYLATENVHEIRSMNTSLYHAGFELQEQLLYDKQKLALAKNVVALSELISARIELADLAASSDGASPGQFTAPIPVYKKFDKIVRCYIAYAAKREITLSLTGENRSQTRGIEHFEMIPLIVIDNAVKYSPNKRQIEVRFREDAANVFIEINSLGPKIEDHEKEAIFDREVRGEHAIRSGQDGSGIGLYFARRLLNRIGGVISVFQDTIPIDIAGRKVFSTTFSVTFQRI